MTPAEKLVKRQLAIVGRSDLVALGRNQAAWCRWTLGKHADYLGLERAASDLRRRAATYRPDGLKRLRVAAAVMMRGPRELRPELWAFLNCVKPGEGR